MILKGFYNLEDVYDLFEISKKDLLGAEIIYAKLDNDYECYHSDCYVLLKRGNELFDVEANCCSCNSYVGQWNMMKTTPKTLRLQPKLYLEISNLLEWFGY